jgi:hypothetical protein
MEKHIFNKLCIELVEHGLKSSKHMRVEEMVVISIGIGRSQKC